MADYSIKYASLAAISCTLTSLADGNSRESAVIDNTSNVYVDVQIRLKLNGQSGGTGLVHVWLYAAIGDTVYTDGATGSDAAFTTANRLNAVALGSVRMNAANSVTKVFTGIAAKFGGVMPEHWGIIVENQSGAALSATAGDFDLDYQGLEYQSV